MPLEFLKAIGICHDCRDGQRKPDKPEDEEGLRGNMRVDLYDLQSTTLAMASGELIDRFANHHDQRRAWGDREVPQHRGFYSNRWG